MLFNRMSPCPDCPFVRGAFLGLRRKRKEYIAAGLLKGDSQFTCHKHITGETDEETGDYIIGKKDQHCAGALITLKKEGALFDNAPIRIAAIFGMYDPDALDMSADTYNSMEEFIEDNDD